MLSFLWKNGICSVQDAVQFIDFINTCHQIHIAMYPTSIDGSIFSCTTCIVYQYFKELGCFRFKSGCKGKGFYFNCQTFSEVFFNFSFYIVSQALLRKGKKVKKKNKPRFFANRTAKIRTLFNNIQNFPEVFLFLF